MFKLCIKLLKNSGKERKLLQDQLQKTPKEWIVEHTNIVKIIKGKLKTLPRTFKYRKSDHFKIIQTDASKLGYCGIQPQKDKICNE